LAPEGTNVQELLAAYESSDGFLDRPPPNATVDEQPVTERPGTVIGPYKLKEQIGEGGMGLVFVAEQQEPVRRKIALKIIKPGMDSKQVIARFEAERQALALMDHQNIAKVFDAGTTESGRPYFVMELVHGVPITEYCDTNKLTPRQRLELFVPVCQAIQHAHQKGIIHRDIKPSNILVTMYDDKPVPKVIDFGVAKAIEQRLTEMSVYTQFGTLVGTLEYMSPEQAEMNAFGVDTRSDIYALGVLLYELLTGTTPLERLRLREAAFNEIVRLIKEEEPQKPSVRLSTSGALAKVAAARKTDPAKLSNLVRGDLDWIVMKCLEKDRSRRYETAGTLARDIERHLHDEPVEARQPSVLYRLRKFVRRNRVAVFLISFVAITAVAVLFNHFLGLLEVRRERDRALAAEAQARAAAEAEKTAKEAEILQRQQAQENERRARAVLAFFQDKVLAAARGKDYGGLGGDVTLLQAMAAAEPGMAAAFADQPLVEASIRRVMGRIYVFGGQSALAIQNHERARALLLSNLGRGHPDTLHSTTQLIEALSWSGKSERAIALLEETIPLLKANSGPADVNTLLHTKLLGLLYEQTGKPERVVPLFEDALARMKKTLGPKDPNTLTVMEALAKAYRATGKLDQALPLFQEALQLMKDVGVTRGPTLFEYMKNLASAYEAARKHPEAVRLYQELLSLQRQEEAADSPVLAETLASLGNCLLHTGNPEKAEPLLRECLTIRQKRQPDDWATFDNQSLLGGSLLAQKKYADAEPLLLLGYKGLKQRQANVPAGLRVERLIEALERLVRLYDAWARPDEAAKWRKELEAIRGGARAR
jgi:non-specific serine/threonine protein kinase/serine/threonine-protein kinase